MAQEYGDDVPDYEKVGEAKIWVGRNVVLFDLHGAYLAEYRWHPKQDRLRRARNEAHLYHKGK
jgi:hypothetical protein